MSIGLQSELGRAGLANTCVGGNVPDYMANRGNNEGGSIFDPVLCELMYSWFCPCGGSVLDPFAGGSVRGVVANFLGYDYTGVELRKEQVVANIEQAHKIVSDALPNWIEGDSFFAKHLLGESTYDFVFSCPPYYNLEVYSKERGELSNFPTYSQFLTRYHSIINDCISLLKLNRFACFVVGNIRDKNGFYYPFVSDTVKAFTDAGAGLYNEAILATAIGSLPIRTSASFPSGRKLGKSHQNILVFYKGDPKKIKANFTEIRE